MAHPVSDPVMHLAPCRLHSILRSPPGTGSRIIINMAELADSFSPKRERGGNTRSRRVQPDPPQVRTSFRSLIISNMPEFVFEAIQEADGGFCAECLTENIFTQGGTWEELRQNVIDATAAFFFDQPRPRTNSPSPGQGRSIVRGMKIPRDVSDERLAETLCTNWRYTRAQQSGSHIILETADPHTSARNVQFDFAGRVEPQGRDA